MSGAGGYYKYRCKYWLTYNCGNWVWVNNAPCANCLAEGRDSEEAILPNTYRYSREIFVPQLENGFLQYSIFQIIAAGDSGWAIKDLPCVVFPTSTGPSAAGGITAMDGVDAQKMSQSGFQASADRE